MPCKNGKLHLIMRAIHFSKRKTVVKHKPNVHIDS